MKDHELVLGHAVLLCPHLHGLRWRLVSVRLVSRGGLRLLRLRRQQTTLKSKQTHEAERE